MERALTEEAKEDKRLGLLDAAISEFFERGFAATRMDDIARRAGVSKGTLYLYFKSKHDMFIGLIEAFALPNVEQVERSVRQAPDAVTAIREIFKFMPLMLRNTPMPYIAKVLIGDAGMFPDTVRQYRNEVIERVMAMIAGVLERGRANGEFDIEDAAIGARLVLAPALMTALWAVVFDPIDPEKQLDVDQLIAQHEKNMLRALNVPEEALS